MRTTIPIRLFAVAIAVGSLTAIPLSSPTTAAAGASCSKLVSPPPVSVKGVSMSNSTVSGCLPTAATGGSGKSATNLKTLISTTTWAGGKGTTIVKVAYKPTSSKGKCPAGTSHILSTGTVTGGTGAAAKVILKGQKVNASVCVNTKTSAATLEPGTKYVF
jgi:hypothetical protein